MRIAQATPDDDEPDSDKCLDQSQRIKPVSCEEDDPLSKSIVEFLKQAHAKQTRRLNWLNRHFSWIMKLSEQTDSEKIPLKFLAYTLKIIGFPLYILITFWP